MSQLKQNWEVERDDGVSILRYDGGERRTLGIEGAGMLAALLEERASRPEPPVLVLVVDVLHAELTEVLEMAAGRPISDWAPWLAAISGLEGYPSATIVAVPTQATCGGLELSLGADIRVAAPDALLGVLEARMGLIPGAGGTQRLPGLIGSGNANLLVLSGEGVSGTEAHRMGLVQLLDHDPVARAVELAELLDTRSSDVLAAAKRALRASRTTTTDGFREEGRGFLSVVGLPETIATMERWVEIQADGDNPATRASPLP
jgi:enoyl-CoA hydratase